MLFGHLVAESFKSFFVVVVIFIIADDFYLNNCRFVNLEGK